MNKNQDKSPEANSQNPPPQNVEPTEVPLAEALTDSKVVKAAQNFETEPVVSEEIDPREAALPPVPETIHPPFQNVSQNPTAKTDSSGSKSDRKKFPKKLFLLLFFLFVFVFGGASIALAYTDYKVISLPEPLKNLIDGFILTAPFPKNSRLVIEKIQEEMGNLKTANLENTFEFKTSAQNFPIKSAQIKVAGPVDFNVAEQKKTQFDVSGLVATEGIQFSAAGSVRIINDKLYFKLTEIPAGAFLPLDNLKNQWFFVNISKTTQGNRPPDAQTIQKVKEAIQKFLANGNTWTTLETKQDVYTLHLKPPKEETNNLIFDFVTAAEPKNQTSLQNDIEKQSLKKFTDQIDKIELDINVSKKTYLPTESNLVLEFKIQNPGFSRQSISLSPTSDIPISLSLNTKFSKYNEPFIVDIPQNAKDFSSYKNNIAKGLIPKSNPANPSQPQPSPFPKPQEQTGIRSFLDNPSPVLGEKNVPWDLQILQGIKLLF